MKKILLVFFSVLKIYSILNETIIQIKNVNSWKNKKYSYKIFFYSKLSIINIYIVF